VFKTNNSPAEENNPKPPIANPLIRAKNKKRIKAPAVYFTKRFKIKDNPITISKAVIGKTNNAGRLRLAISSKAA